MKPNKTSPLTELTAIQLQAIDFLMIGYSHRQVGENVGVSRESVTRWVNYHPAFQAELNRRRKELAESSLDRLRDLVPKALDAIEDVLRNHDDPNRSKIALEVLKAAGPLAFMSDRLIVGGLEPEEILEEMTKAEHDPCKAAFRPSQEELINTAKNIEERLKEQRFSASNSNEQSSRSSLRSQDYGSIIPITKTTEGALSK